MNAPIRPNRLVRLALTLAALLPAGTAFAQDAGPSFFETLGNGAIATVVYGLLGIVLAIIGYKVFEVVLPFNVKHELEEDHNMAVGVLLAAMVLGIAIIVAATIHS